MINGAFGIIYAALTGDQQNVDFIAQPRGTQKIPLADRGVEEEEVTVVPVPFASHSLSGVECPSPGSSVAVDRLDLRAAREIHFGIHPQLVRMGWW